jgi:tagatose 1,6-diphosphate aldolase
MDITAGKLWGLRRLADPAGRFKMTAVDQRPPIMNPIKAKLGLDDAPYDDVAAVKALLTRTLAAESSAMLVDPIWAFPEAWPDLRPDRGLLVTLEDHQFDDGPGGRKSSAIANWTVPQIKRMGADGVKVLAWYRPDAAPDVRRHQQAFVRAIGHACKRYDIPFLFELLVYPFAQTDGTGSDYVEHREKRPEMVIDSVRAFSDPGFGIDIFKLESPLAAPDVPDPDGPEAADCQDLFDRLGAAAGRPWVMLSAGASMSQFKRVLTYAYRAGASGYLAGRAIWSRAFEQFPDMDAFEAELIRDALPYMRELNEMTDRMAQPWTDCFTDRVWLAGGGPDFPMQYPAPTEVR